MGARVDDSGSVLAMSGCPLYVQVETLSSRWIYEYRT